MKQKYLNTSIYATYGISNQVEVVFVLPYITARGNATQEVLTNLNLENERKGIQDVSVLLNTVLLILTLVHLHYALWCLRFKNTT
jgi:hypothetical protein